MGLVLTVCQRPLRLQDMVTLRNASFISFCTIELNTIYIDL